MTHRDIHENRVSISDEAFDFQVPIGSICQHRFTDIKIMEPLPILKPNPKNNSTPTVLFIFSSSRSVKKLIGISWREIGPLIVLNKNLLSLTVHTNIAQPA